MKRTDFTNDKMICYSFYGLSGSDRVKFLMHLNEAAFFINFNPVITEKAKYLILKVNQYQDHRARLKAPFQYHHILPTSLFRLKYHLHPCRVTNR